MAVSYIQMIGIGSQTVYTRCIWDSINLLERIARRVLEETGGKLLVLVHNLSYEWQHMKRYLTNIEKVFARSVHDVIEIVTDCLVFRCTYAFTRLSLARVADMYTDVKKAEGDLDYGKMRTPVTRLTFREYYYCFYDIEVLRRFYDMELFPNWLKKKRLPMTSTGKVREAMRRSLRRHCKDNGLSTLKYHYYLEKCQLTETQYDLARKCFVGAYTHADARFTNQLLEADSFDIGSSYPYNMLVEDYPMTPFKWVKPNVKWCKTHCCMMTLRIWGVRPLTYHHILSYSKVNAISNPKIDNGRIISADYIELCCTEVDLHLLMECYEWDKNDIVEMMVSNRGKLPAFIRKEMMEWYNAKNELKGVKGKEDIYMSRKELVNGIFGSMVTDILNNDIVLDENLILTEHPIKNKAKRLKEVQSSRTAYTLYQWGVYVIAYGRKNLFDTVILPIEEEGGVVAYSDTDSAKTPTEGMEKVFDGINEKKHDNVCRELESLGMPLSYAHDLGQICKENKKRFKIKTLGAKRYVVQGDNHQRCTVSGLSWEGFNKYLKEEGMNIFDTFTNGLEVPPEFSGRTSSYYRENVSRETLTDYQGNVWTGEVGTGIVIEPSPFTMKLEPQYVILMNKERRGKS